MTRPRGSHRIAYDETPLNAPSPDLPARLGWLLTMSRLHHPDASFEDGDRFAACLADAGFPADAGLVGRWESGQAPVPYEAITAYEQVLDLRPDLVGSTAGYLWASPPGPAAHAMRPRLDPSSREFSRRLDGLVDAAEQGTAAARDWQSLGWHLSAVPMEHLRSPVWELLARRMVALLPRSVDVAYRQLSTAAMTLADRPRARDFLVDAIADYLSDPAVQVVANPLVLLDNLPTRQAARLVLEVVERPMNLVAYQMAVWLATQKLVRNELSASERTALQMLVLHAWRRDPERAAEDLAELVAALPPGMRATLVQASSMAGRPGLGYAVEHGEDVAPATASGFASRVAEAARDGAPQDPAYDEDRMLARLVREALFHRDTARRHGAALLLSASPFASSTADVLLARLATPADPAPLRVRMAVLVRYLGGESHRLRLVRMLDRDVEEVAVPLIQALGHLEYSVTSDHTVRSALHRDWSSRERAKLYVLGMTGSPGLPAIARSERAPEWQRSAARWWLDIGPAVRA